MREKQKKGEINIMVIDVYKEKYQKGKEVFDFIFNFNSRKIKLTIEYIIGDEILKQLNMYHIFSYGTVIKTLINDIPDNICICYYYTLYINPIGVFCKICNEKQDLIYEFSSSIFSSTEIINKIKEIWYNDNE